MAQRIQQEKTTSADGVTTQTTRAVTDEGMAANTTREPESFVAARVVWYIAGVITTLLALRFVLALLGANKGNGFVDFIYNVSHPFAAPFFGIFNYQTQYGVSKFELSTLVAIVVYLLVAWGLARLVTIRHPQD